MANPNWRLEKVNGFGIGETILYYDKSDDFYRAWPGIHQMLTVANIAPKLFSVNTEGAESVES